MHSENMSRQGDHMTSFLFRVPASIAMTAITNVSDFLKTLPFPLIALWESVKDSSHYLRAGPF